MISPNEVESQDSFVRSGGSPPATEQRSLAWFCGRSALVVRRFIRFATTFPTIAYDIKLSTHCEDVPEGRYCYCCECVDIRNAPAPASRFLDKMLHAGLTLQRQVDPHLHDDISFLLERINSLPDAPIVKDQERFQFDRAIDALRAEHRTRPAINRSLLDQTFESESSAWLPWSVRRSSAPTFGTRGSCYSIRQRTQKPSGNKVSRSIESVKRYDDRHGAVLRMWHRPDHLIFGNETAACAKPRYTEHVVLLGDKAVNPDEIYSQGKTRATVFAKETVVTDWWAASHIGSTWEDFIGDAIKIRLKNGDRMRDEFFEPTKEQIADWISQYTKDAEFKYVRRERFSKTLPKWLFNNQTDEAPVIAQAFDLKELEHDFNNVFEDGVQIDQTVPEEISEGQVYEVTVPAPGKPFHGDKAFVHELNQMLPKGYSKLPVYSCGRKMGDSEIVIPQLAAPRDLDPSTFAVVERPRWCQTYPIAICDVKPAKASQVGEGYSDGGRTEKTLEGVDRSIMLGTLTQPTADELKQAEADLRDSADYSRELHEIHRHFYTDYYRYYPAEWPDPKKTTIFKFLRDTTRDKNINDVNTEDTWDDAIPSTFGHLHGHDLPKDGFYVMHRVNPRSEWRVYLIHPELPSTGVDAWDDCDMEYMESPAPFGRDDIYAQIRTVVNEMRVKTRSPITVTGSLRKLVKTGKVRHIRFDWNDIQGLIYVVSS